MPHRNIIRLMVAEGEGQPDDFSNTRIEAGGLQVKGKFHGLLKGLDERLRHETGMPIHIADRPLDCVALGSGKCVEEFEALQQVLISEPRH